MSTHNSISQVEIVFHTISVRLFHAEHGLPTSFDNLLQEGYMWEMYNFPFRASLIFPIIPQSHDHCTAGFFHYTKLFQKIPQHHFHFEPQTDQTYFSGEQETKIDNDCCVSTFQYIFYILC